MLRFKVMPDGAESFEVEATTRDISRWEKLHRGASFGALREHMRMVDLYKVAYYAAVRHGCYAGTLDEFERAVDLNVLPDRPDEVDPTPPDRSTES